ncbi:MAG: hypothetical protein ACKOBC_09825 [Hyphomicrobiales bacterium]
MKNVTISMDEETAAWARVEAAKAGKSLSRYVGDILEERRTIPSAQEALENFEAFMKGPGLSGLREAWHKRDELYAEHEERIISRHQSSRLRT